MEVSKLPQAMALLNNFIIELTLKSGSTNLASAQRTFDVGINRALSALA
ncbi:MAG: hypothetical protein Fur0021_40790 [Candidatus Promineifilaceae bacterium]